jgi:hypothetical protein
MEPSSHYPISEAGVKIRQLIDSHTNTDTYLVWDEVSREAAMIDSVREQLERDIQLIDVVMLSNQVHGLNRQG